MYQIVKTSSCSAVKCCIYWFYNVYQFRRLNWWFFLALSTSPVKDLSLYTLCFYWVFQLFRWYMFSLCFLSLFSQDNLFLLIDILKHFCMQLRIQSYGINWPWTYEVTIRCVWTVCYCYSSETISFKVLKLLKMSWNHLKASLFYSYQKDSKPIFAPESFLCS